MTQGIFKPMLAATLEEDTPIPFPVLASPKLDGVRAIVMNGVVVSRNLKPIPNKHVQALFGKTGYEGLDGELIVGEPSDPDVFRNTTSGVMSVEGIPDVKFFVFDCAGYANWEYGVRSAHVRSVIKPVWEGLPKRGVTITAEGKMPKYSGDVGGYSKKSDIYQVNNRVIKTQEELDDYEAKCLELGYEGCMLRSPTGLYKFGRSTLKEFGLVKVKRFMDGEAVVIGVEELMHNENEKKVNELGNAKRSSHKAGMVGAGVLGSLIVKDLVTGVEFNIGSGFTEEERVSMWGSSIVGATVSYRYFPTGSKSKPRFPTYKGVRHEIDL